MPNDDVRLQSEFCCFFFFTTGSDYSKGLKDPPHIHQSVIYYLMPEKATWESTFFLRVLWLKWSWPQCKHMSERWLTISLYNSLSTHPGSANSCPHYSQGTSERARLACLNIAHGAQTKPTDHGLPAQKQVKGAAWLSQPRRRGPESGEGRGRVSIPRSALTKQGHREALFGETAENIQPPDGTDTSLLSKMMHNTDWQTPDKHTHTSSAS